MSGLRPLDLGLGTAVFPPTPLIRRAVERHLDGPKAALYPPRGGTVTLRSLLAERHAHVGATERSVVLACGATQAITALLRVTCAAGDRVCLPDPGFPHYRLICEFLGLRAVGYPQPGPGQPFPLKPLREILRATEPRVLIWNSPANPTGWVATEDDLRAVAALVAGQPAHVLSDEVYEELVFDGEHRSLAAHLPPDRVTTAHSFSKSLSMAGWRLGYLIAPPNLAPAAERAVWAMSMGAPTIAQDAAVGGLLEAGKVLPGRRAELAERQKTLRRALTAAGLPAAPIPQGGCFLWLDARRHESLAEELRASCQITVSDGRAFGSRGAGCVRLSFGAATADIEEAARRLAQWHPRAHATHATHEPQNRANL